jgi:hypothetical protein
VEDRRRRVIYCYTNECDQQRKYVGQAVCRTETTSPERAIEQRWQNGYKGCWRFIRAIGLYGIGAFWCEPLEVVRGIDAANEAERRWIAQLQSQHPTGYNLSPGGGVGPVHEESRRRMRQAAHRREAGIPKEERVARARRSAAKVPAEYRGAWMKEWWASLTEDEYEALRRRIASGQSIESRRENGRASHARRGPESYVSMVMAAAAIHRATPKAVHSERRRKGWARLTPEQRDERIENMVDGKKRALTPEKVQRAAAVVQHARDVYLGTTTAEERSENARKAGLASGNVIRAKPDEWKRARYLKIRDATRANTLARMAHLSDPDDLFFAPVGRRDDDLSSD